MRWLRLPLLLLALACGEKEEPAGAGAAPVAPVPAPGIPAPAAETPPHAEAAAPAEGALIAERRYEVLTNGRRAAVLHVTWRWVERDGRRLVQDVTESNARSARMMGQVRDIFASRSVTRLLRTEEGELLSMDTVTETPARIDRVSIERTEKGYAVRTAVGANLESFEIATGRPAMVDAEAFLGTKIRAGEAQPGATWTLPLLSVPRREVVDATLRVAGPDDEGPGLKVVQSFEGDDELWWFAEDGSVVRHRAGISVIRRDDTVGLDDLPARPAAWRITLPAGVDLPRIFTGRSMLVEIRVRTDETTKAPRIAENPFTEVLAREDGRVEVRLRSHDNPAARATLPLDREGFEEHLKATPLMEVEDPGVVALARQIVGKEKGARAAARKIADYVFTSLGKGSPDIPEPTVKEILRDRVGDCSEHALLFTGLCRAAGIPARRCSGYVCIGDDWGAHAWCEIFVGEWIGADPTTNEIGTRARYIFLGRPDDPATPRAHLTPERTEIRIKEAEYADGSIDLTDPDSVDLEVLSGIRLGPLPGSWQVERRLAHVMIRGEDFTALAWIAPDHGYRSLDLMAGMRMASGERTTFGAREALVHRRRGQSRWIVPLGRQNLYLHLTGSPPEVALAKALAPTLDRDDG